MPQLTIGDIQTIVAQQLRCNLSRVSPHTDIRNLGAIHTDLCEICLTIEEKYKIRLEIIASIDIDAPYPSMSIPEEITPAMIFEHC